MCVPGSAGWRVHRDCEGCPSWVSKRDAAQVMRSLSLGAVEQCVCRVYAVYVSELDAGGWRDEPRGYVVAPSYVLAAEFACDALRRRRSGVEVVPVTDVTASVVSLPRL